MKALLDAHARREGEVLGISDQQLPRLLGMSCVFDASDFKVE